MSIDNTDQLGASLSTMTGAFGIELTPKMIETFKSEGTFGVPMGDLKTYLAMNASKRPQYLQQKGIPLDSINGGMSEFQQWVNAARQTNEDIKIALKADASTPYKTVKRVMNELQDMDESHYYMITQLKQQGTNKWLRKKANKRNECPRRLYAYGGYAYASYHVLHAVYIFEQTSDYGADNAK